MFSWKTKAKRVEHKILRDTIEAFFLKPLNNAAYYGLALLISTIYVLTLFPLNFFAGTNPFWFDINTDPTQHVTGLWAFLADDWHFPLLYPPYLNYPQGVSAAYADIIPLAAILFKPIAGLFPSYTHYFGIWVFLCYLLQGVAGAYFLGNALKKTLLYAITGAMFSVMMPSLMIRIPHSALLMQSLLLFTLAFYYLGINGKIKPTQATRRQGVLILTAALIHPYFLAMLYPLYFVTHLSFVIKHKEKLSYALKQNALILFLVILLLWVVGYIIPGQGVFSPANGFDINSMNLLSPFLGTYLAGSAFLPSGHFVLDATGLQIDGHNYLGISVLLLSAYIVIFQTRSLAKALFNHWPMVLLMIAFTIYALSNKIYVADTLLVSYDLPSMLDKITGTFRSSGRFFWTVGYMILFGTLLLFIKTCRQKLLIPVLILLVSLQYIDTAPHREYLQEASHRKPYFKVDHAIWSRLVASSNNVYLFPTYGCGADCADTLTLQYFTTRQNKHFNTGFVARAQGDCLTKNAILQNPKAPGDLYIFSKDKISKTEVSKMMGKNFDRFCRQHAFGIVCKIGSNANEWQQYTDGHFSTIDMTPIQ